MARELVHVLWEDAAHELGWIDAPESVPFHMVESVGWLIKKNEHHVVIVQSQSGEEVAQMLQIPAAMVHKVTTLRPPKLSSSHGAQASSMAKAPSPRRSVGAKKAKRGG